MVNLGELEVPLEYQSIFDPRTCTRRGMCPITRIHRQRPRLQGHSLYFEVHGNGPQRIVFIMGLNNTSFSWLPQVDYFSKLNQYTTLVFDNRGVGLSGSPWAPYSSTAMAEDTIDLLDYLQWKEDHTLHVVGVSLGGMIAQELAYRIPERMMSLSLVATRAGGNLWTNIPPLPFCLGLARNLVTADPELKVSFAMGTLFPEEWLDSLAENDPVCRTNREVEAEAMRRRTGITKLQPLMGALGQMAAGLTHNMAPDRLAKISVSVPKVLILCGDEDSVFHQIESEYLKRHMPEAEYQCWEKTGHGISRQHKQRFNQLIEKVFEQGKVAAGGV